MLSFCNSNLDCASKNCQAFTNYDYLSSCLRGLTSDCFCMETYVSSYDSCESSENCAINDICAEIAAGKDRYCIPCSSRGYRFPTPRVDDSSFCDVQHKSVSPSSTSSTYLEACLDSDNCDMDLVCRTVTHSGLINYCSSSDASNCFCIPDNSMACTESSECPAEYGCATISGSNAAYCIPCDAVGNRSPPPRFVDDQHMCPSPAPSLTPTPSSTPSSTPSLGASSSSTPSDIVPAVSGGLFSISPVLSSRPNESQSGDTPEPSEAESEPCIAIDALQGFSKNQLVFKEHRRAAVLCDEMNNCATPGHIVVHSGTHMMMRSYCELLSASCKRTVKLVNSPLMKRGLRIASESHQLQFTALSARHETRLEELAMKLLLSTGF